MRSQTTTMKIENTIANNHDLFQSFSGRRELELEVDVSTALPSFN